MRSGDGSTVQIKGKGSVLLQCKNGEQRLLSEVYYIPSLCNNIISLGQLSKGGCKTIIHLAYLYLYDSSGHLVAKVRRSCNRLYKVLLDTCKPIRLMANIEEPAWL